MANGNTLSVWQMDCIDKLIESGKAELILIISNDNITSSSKFRKLFHKNLLYFLWTRFFLKVSVEEQSSFEEKFKHIPVLKCKTQLRSKHAEYFHDTDITKIKIHEPDFILRFGFNILKGEILTSAKYGVWSYHHGNEQEFRGGPPGFWEIYKRKPTTGVILQKLTEKLDSGIILEKREYKTIQHSYKEQKQKMFFSNTDMPLVAVKQLLNYDYSCMNGMPSTTSAKIYKFPTNLQLLVFFLKLINARLCFYFNKYFLAEQWGLALINNSNTNYKIGKNSTIDKEYISVKKNIFYADGFLFSKNNKTFCVCEKYDYKKGKGEISVMPIDNSFGKESNFLTADTHLAYPYVFVHENTHFLLPETANENQLKLYSISEEDNQPKYIANLLDNFPAIDASIVYDGNYFWIFCGNKNDHPNEKLFIFYSKTLIGTYTPHLKNPVKVTPAGSRSAGNIILDTKFFIRPAQYSVNYYGEKIILHKINKLTPCDFSEEMVDEITPAHFNKKWKGIHTVSQNGSVMLIDFKHHTFIGSALVDKFKKR